MKLTTSVLILALTGYALAQAPANKTATPANKQATAAKPATATGKPTTTTKPATAAAKPGTAVAKPATVAPAKTAPAATAPKQHAPTAKPIKPADSKLASKPVNLKSTKAVKKDQAAAPAAPPAPTAAETKPAAPALSKNRRDPFVSVIMSREGPPCAGGGKKCIAIDQVTLQGVVRSPNGAIAVVSSGANKTYFLRENDPVYNGVVVKIAPDSIIFRETVMDRLGKTSQREVVKKIRNSPSV